MTEPTKDERPDWGDMQLNELLHRAHERMDKSRYGRMTSREMDADILVIRDLVTALEQTRTALAEEEMRAHVLTGLYRSAEREAMQHRPSPLENEVKEMLAKHPEFTKGIASAGLLDLPIAGTKPKTRPVCPECVQGKHVNCDGTALDPVTDEVVACGCGAC